MDAYEDALKAFDSLIEWLGRHPNIEYDEYHPNIIGLSRPGLYRSELIRRADRLGSALNYLSRNYIKLPTTYAWQRLEGEYKREFRFDLGRMHRFDEEAQAEIREVVSSARDDLISSRKPIIKARAPQISMDEYENILGIIHNWSEGIERSPKGPLHQSEETLRDQCVTTLHTHFPGQVTAESKNKNGKTDIRMSVDSGALFIAECKIWNGPAGVLKALDQLMGYLTWRDNKALLLIFNRSGSRLDVIDSARTIASKHQHHKFLSTKRMPNGSRHKFRDPSDQKSEITITIIVVDIPSEKS